MRKASDILLIISAVLAFLLAFGYLAGGIVFFVFASPQSYALLVEQIANGQIEINPAPATPEEGARAIQLVFLILGIVMLVLMLFAIAEGVLALFAKKKHSTVLYILNVVMGFLSGTLVSVVGGILGIVSKDE